MGTNNTIALVIDGFGYGGIQQAYLALIKEFSKKFKEVYLFVIDAKKDDLEFDFSSNIRKFDFESRKMVDFSNLHNFRKILKELSPEIIISSMYRSQIWSAILKPKNSKLIWVEHNTYFERTSFQWLIMKLLAIRVDKIVGVSQAVSDFSGSKLKRLVQTVPNPYSKYSTKLNLKKRKNVFIFVARLTRQKNPLLMIESFCLFVQEYDSEAILHVVGGGNLIKFLQTKVLEMNLHSNVLFHNFIPTQEVYRLLQESKTLVSTSMFEGMGLNRLEALAHGCCVVTTKTGGTDLFKTLGRSGFFVVGAEKREIARAMFESMDSKYWNVDNIIKRSKIVNNFEASKIAARLVKFS